MPHLIEVAFKGNRKEFFLWEGETPPPVTAPVIVEADRGEDLGRVHATEELAAKRFEGCTHGRLALDGAEPSKRVRRLATPEDARRLRELREQDESARRKAMERVKANGLVMKLTDAEWQWDRRKLTIYFTAERRVDFRTLVRDLAALFRTRIELKQIGVRDEARRLSGIGRCGREYCSASWLPELRPVNLGVAKDQRLSLNPSQISGACGRLMCCLRYEHEYYVQARKRFPKEGRILATARGEEKVVSTDIFNERVTLRNAEGETRVVPLAELRREMGVGQPDEETPSEDELLPLEITDEELISLTDTAERPAYRPGAARAPGRESGTPRGTPISLERRRAREGAEPTGPRPARPSRTVVISSDQAAAASSADEQDGTHGSATPAAEEGPERRENGEGPRPPRRRRGRRGGRRGRGARGGGAVTSSEPDSGHDNDSEDAE